MNALNFNKVWVVGDKLKSFARQTGMMSVSDLEKFVTSNESLKSVDKSLEVIIGQGVSESKITQIHRIINASQFNNKIVIKAVANTRKRTSKKLAHKRLNKNTMVSDPIKVDESIYESFLMLDDRCAEMSDHVTGQHLQGMIMIEAARQLTLVVTEKFFLTDEKRCSMAFLTNTLETKFHNFVFPTEVKIRYKILERRGLANSNQVFKVSIEFIQNGQIGAEVIYKFSVFESQFIKEKEQKMAMDTASSY